MTDVGARGQRGRLSTEETERVDLPPDHPGGPVGHDDLASPGGPRARPSGPCRAFSTDRVLMLPGFAGYRQKDHPRNTVASASAGGGDRVATGLTRTVDSTVRPPSTPASRGHDVEVSLNLA